MAEMFPSYVSYVTAGGKSTGFGIRDVSLNPNFMLTSYVIMGLSFNIFGIPCPHGEHERIEL